MKPSRFDSDDTVRVPHQQPRSKYSQSVVALAVIAVLLIGAGSGWLLWPHRHTPGPQQATTPPAVSPIPAPAFQIETASELQIRDHVPGALTVFRLSTNPRILVLDFASLHEQGMMLNRVAALVEKAGLPHDRVLNDGELADAIRVQGDTVETFYYGHDYSAAALARFFALADRDKITLHAEEETLRSLLKQEGWFAAELNAGLISLPAVGADDKVTQAARTAILRHELSHGEFFSDPNYAAYVRDFWLTSLTEAERDGVRRFLAAEDYDASQEELMYNEMQAYLMFTRDPVFFTAKQVGLSSARLSELQNKFLDRMPPGWLRDILAEYQKVLATTP